MGDEWWGTAESLIQDQLKSQLFSAGILAKAISMTHSDMLYRLNISTFCFNESLLLQIFVPWKFIKTQAFPCLLSLLLSTATQITICFKYLQNFLEILYSMKSLFLLKYLLRFFIFKFDLTVKHNLFFLITMVYRNK